MANQSAKPYMPTINTSSFDLNNRSQALDSINQFRENDRLFRSIEAVTTGFSEFSDNKDREAGRILAAQSAGEITNFLRSGDAGSGIAMQLLNAVGIESEGSLTSSVATLSNQYMGRARFNAGFGKNLATGLADRVNDISNPLSALGFGTTGDAVEGLGARNMMDIGGINLQGALSKDKIEELKKKAIAQVEDMASIFEAGKEIGLSVDQTLTAFQAFTGGDLSGRIGRAEQLAIRGVAAQGGGAAAMEAASRSARQETSKAITQEFRAAQIAAENAGTDLSSLLATSSLGAAQLAGMGIEGAHSAMLGEVTALTGLSQGTGATQAQIAQMATGRVATAMRTREGKAGAVLLNAAASGVIDATDPAVAAAIQKFKTTGQMDMQQVHSILSAQGLESGQISSLTTDVGVRHALNNPEVLKSVTESQKFNEQYNFTGHLKRSMGDQMKKGSLKGLSSGMKTRVQEAILAGLKGAEGGVQGQLAKLGLTGSDLAAAQQFGAIIENEADRKAMYDDRIENVALTLRSEDRALVEEQAISATSQLAFQDTVTGMARTIQTRKALKGLGLSEADVETYATDKDKLGGYIKSRQEEALDLDKKATALRAAGKIDEAKKLEDQAAELRSGTDKLSRLHKGPSADQQNIAERLGNVLSSIGAAGAGGASSADLATLQNLAGELFGMDRREVAGLVTEELGVRDSKGKIVSLNEAELVKQGVGKMVNGKFQYNEGISEEIMLEMVQNLDEGLQQSVSEEAKEQARKDLEEDGVGGDAEEGEGTGDATETEGTQVVTIDNEKFAEAIKTALEELSSDTSEKIVERLASAKPIPVHIKETDIPFTLDSDGSGGGEGQG